jgi:AhpC/TSA family
VSEEEKSRPDAPDPERSGPLSFEDFDELDAPSAAEEDDDRPRGPARPPGATRYGWLVGVIVILVLAYITLNTVRTESTGSAGVPAGEPLPPFAVPLALGDLEGDANVATRPGEGERGSRPACEVRGPKVLNSCQLEERGPVVLAFAGTRGGRCKRELDTMQRVSRLPGSRGVQFAALAIRGDRGKLRDDIRSRGWRFPVGYDRDGLVANLYGVSVCPTITFAYPGGVVQTTTIGELGETALARRVRTLVAGSEKRGWTPPAS